MKKRWLTSPVTTGSTRGEQKDTPPCSETPSAEPGCPSVPGTQAVDR